MLRGVEKRQQFEASGGRITDRRAWRGLTFAALALAAGCATSPEPVKVIHSRPAATALDRIYVLVFRGSLAWERAEEVRQALADALQPRAKALATMVASGMELDKGPARADIDAFRADGLLVVRPAGSEAGGGSATYDVAILDPAGQRTTWHAKLVSEAGPGAMAQDLVRQLAWDGLLAAQPGDERPRPAEPAP